MTLDRAERQRRAQTVLRSVKMYVTLHDPSVQQHAGEAVATERSWEQLLMARGELNRLIEAERHHGGDAWTAFAARRAGTGDEVTSS